MSITVRYIILIFYDIYRKTLLNAIQYFVHLNLAIALLLALLVFVGGIERAKENEVSLCTHDIRTYF